MKITQTFKWTLTDCRAMVLLLPLWSRQNSSAPPNLSGHPSGSCNLNMLILYTPLCTQTISSELQKPYGPTSGQGPAEVCQRPKFPGQTFHPLPKRSLRSLRRRPSVTAKLVDHPQDRSCRSCSNRHPSCCGLRQSQRDRFSLSHDKRKRKDKCKLRE